MFTGIIETQGILKNIEDFDSNRILWLECPISCELKVDQSVAHNGVCLTVEEVNSNSYRVTAIRETLVKSNVKSWKIGDVVNIERCLQLNGRLDGHIVQGHVDTVGVCTNVKQMQGSWEFRIKIPKEFAHLVIEKGSICVNGISLTAFEVDRAELSVAIIPYTYQHTNIRHVKEGDSLNIEFDVIGKYIQRWQQIERQDVMTGDNM